MYLAKQGLADKNRLCIDGGSAGGYTTLSALAFRDVFKAGCSLYGVGDLTALVRGTRMMSPLTGWLCVYRSPCVD
jgi:dipeptidyl aminopeptidase/acylaminoacyl peptidase